VSSLSIPHFIKMYFCLHRWYHRLFNFNNILERYTDDGCKIISFKLIVFILSSLYQLKIFSTFLNTFLLFFLRKDMFDKPNTTGFLHVSHYLSTIYDAKLFKHTVKWPISCKKDEATYRAEIKNFFSVLSKDNPDTKIPSILMSHLVQSTGTKFLTFMWKLSQLALRIYIKGERM